MILYVALLVLLVGNQRVGTFKLSKVLRYQRKCPFFCAIPRTRQRDFDAKLRAAAGEAQTT